MRIFMSVGLIVGVVSVATLYAEDSVLDQATEMTLVNPVVQKSGLGSLQADTAFNLPGAVSVINKNTITRYNFQSLAEALRTLAGVEVERTYLKKNIPFARGLLQTHYAANILLLIDGVPTWQAVTGEGNLARVNVHDVERIEVMKGVATAFYGAHAFTAVINVILRDPAKEGAQAHAGLGDHGKKFGGINYSTKLKGFDLYMSVNQSDEDGKNVLFNGEPSTDGGSSAGNVREFEEGGSYLFRLKNENHRFLFNGFRAVEDNLGVSAKFSAGAGNDFNSEGYLGSYRYRRDLNSTTRLELGGSYDWNERSFSRSRNCKG